METTTKYHVDTFIPEHPHYSVNPLETHHFSTMTDAQVYVERVNAHKTGAYSAKARECAGCPDKVLA